MQWISFSITRENIIKNELLLTITRFVDCLPSEAISISSSSSEDLFILNHDKRMEYSYANKQRKLTIQYELQCIDYNIVLQSD